MTIQWYPGHIAKAERKLKEQLNLVDVVLEIVDARIPLSSKYINIEKLIGSKPRLLIMNKSDLADAEQCKKWQDFLSEHSNLKVVITTTNSSKDLSSIVSNAVDLGKNKIAQLVAKGMLPRPIRAMIIGMPNVGKSSILNKITKRKKAKVGPKAGITRQQQWVRINPKLELLDTPGIIPMKIEDQESAYKLAMVNSIGEHSYDSVEVAKKLVALIYEKYPKYLVKNYKLENIDKEPELEDIALSRHWVLLGGEPDVNRCASIVLSDFRNGRIGKMTLEDIKNVED